MLVKNISSLFLLVFIFVTSCKKDDKEIAPLLAEITTKEPTEIGYYQALIHGEITNLGSEEVYEYGFVWATTPAPTTNASGKKYFGSTTNAGSFSEKIMDLNMGTLYYYRTFAITKSGIIYGNEKSFTTLKMPWIKVSSFEGVGRSNALAFSIGSIGYVGFGNPGQEPALKDFWAYDPSSKVWTQRADFPGAGRQAGVAFSIGNKGYIGIGIDFKPLGSTYFKDFWEYDPTSDKWTQKADFPGGAMYYAASFVVGNKGYIGTGVVDGAISRELWEYDPINDKWTKKADFPGKAADVAVGFSINNKGYIGTGILPIGSSKDFWEYDPINDNWTQKADYPGDSWGFTVGFAINDRGYIGIGHGGANELWEYNPSTNQWVSSINFIGENRYGATSFVIGEKAYIGTGSGSGFLKDFWEFSPSIK